MAPFLHDFVIYMHTHARADTYTLTHTHTHTRTCSALFLCPIHVPRMFDMHLLRAWPASLHSSCRPLFLPPPLSLPLFLGCPAAWQLIWQMRKLPENATSLPTQRRSAVKKKKKNTKKKQIAVNVQSIWMPKTLTPSPLHAPAHSRCCSQLHSICGFSVTLGHNLIATELCCGHN